MSTRALAPVATLGLAAAAWVVALGRMRGMDMGASTELGSLSLFLAAWVPMMAAMMLPGAVPAVWRRARAGGGQAATLPFVASYLAVWAGVGLVVHALYAPHRAFVAGALTVAAGAYELTPLKRACRRRCRQEVRSGLELGVFCVGSSIGLMVVLVAVGPMSVTWTAVVAAVVLAQKLVAARPAVDLPLALAIVAFGVVVAVAPSSVPGLAPSM
jgi:predicted metal-binding membrane protein